MIDRSLASLVILMFCLIWSGVYQLNWSVDLSNYLAIAINSDWTEIYTKQFTHKGPLLFALFEFFDLIGLNSIGDEKLIFIIINMVYGLVATKFILELLPRDIINPYNIVLVLWPFFLQNSNVSISIIGMTIYVLSLLIDTKLRNYFFAIGLLVVGVFIRIDFCFLLFHFIYYLYTLNKLRTNKIFFFSLVWFAIILGSLKILGFELKEIWYFNVLFNFEYSELIGSGVVTLKRVISLVIVFGMALILVFWSLWEYDKISYVSVSYILLCLLGFFLIGSYRMQHAIIFIGPLLVNTVLIRANCERKRELTLPGLKITSVFFPLSIILGAVYFGLKGWIVGRDFNPAQDVIEIFEENKPEKIFVLGCLPWLDIQYPLETASKTNNVWEVKKFLSENNFEGFRKYLNVDPELVTSSVLAIVLDKSSFNTFELRRLRLWLKEFGILEVTEI